MLERHQESQRQVEKHTERRIGRPVVVAVIVDRSLGLRKTNDRDRIKKRCNTQQAVSRVCHSVTDSELRGISNDEVEKCASICSEMRQIDAVASICRLQMKAIVICRKFAIICETMLLHVEGKIPTNRA